MRFNRSCSMRFGFAVFALALASCSGGEPEEFSSSGEGGGPGGDSPGGIIDSGVDPGGDSGGGDPSHGGSSTSGLGEIADAFCVFIDRCESEFGPTFQSTEQCDDFFGVLVDTTGVFGSPDLFDANPDAIDACLTAVESAPCGDAFSQEGLPSCDGEALFVGTVPEGACCDERDGCEPGTYCDGADEDTLGVCTAFLPLNGDCAESRCEPGTRCVSDGTASRCEGLASAGEGCAEGECADPLVCVGLPDGVCAAPLEDGEMCESDSECESGDCFFTCQSAQDDLPGFGEVCTDSCASGIFGDLFCVPESPGATQNRCTGPVTEENAPCDSQGLSAADCSPLFGLFCDADTNRCAALPTLDEPCDSVCAPLETVFCDIPEAGAAGQCRARVPEGAACEPLPLEFFFVTQCEVGLTCQNNRCSQSSFVDPVCPAPPSAQ